jgi:1,4-dihydroxy-2-naphthoate octaprenyltransferase
MNGVKIRVLPFLAALTAALLIQIGTNYANDYFDYQNRADTDQRLGPRRLIQSGLASPHQVLVAAGASFGLAALIGLYLVWVGGWPILVIGVFSILAGVAYTGGPWPLGYHGLGDVFCFVFFGLLAVNGSAYLQIGHLTAVTLLASIPIGLLVTAILIVNNLRDIDTDRLAGKKTLAVRLGRKGARIQYIVFVSAAYLIPPLLWIGNQSHGPFWLPWLTFPLAIRAMRVVSTSTEGPPLNRVLKTTGQLHLLFGMLFAVSLWLSW